MSRPSDIKRGDVLQLVLLAITIALLVFTLIGKYHQWLKADNPETIQRIEQLEALHGLTSEAGN